jgi:hypothetical protein
LEVPRPGVPDRRRCPVTIARTAETTVGHSAIIGGFADIGWTTASHDNSGRNRAIVPNRTIVAGRA